MSTFTLAATTRTTQGKAVKNMRMTGRIPAVMYGRGLPTVHLELDAMSFGKIFSTAGESTLLDVVIDGGQPAKALIQDVQYDPVKHRIIHADLRAVNMKEKITAEIRLVLVGEAPIIKASAAMLNKVHETVEVECLPGDLVSELNIPVTGLTEVGQIIRVRDLAVPAGMTILADPNEALVTVTAALTEEQIKAMEEQPVGDVSAIEVVEKKKTEEGAEPVVEDKKE